MNDLRVLHVAEYGYIDVPVRTELKKLEELPIEEDVIEETPEEVVEEPEEVTEEPVEDTVEEVVEETPEVETEE